MTDPHAYFNEATDTLDPDVDSLVAGGLERGRARRARRTTLTAVAAGAAVAVLAVGAVAVPQLLDAGEAPSIGPAGRGGEGRAVDPTPTRESTPPQSSTPRTLAVTPKEVPETFASLVPGDIEVDQAFPADGEGAIAHFRWNGAYTSVFLERSEGETALEHCSRLNSSPGYPCEEQPDGSVRSTWQERQPIEDGGVTGRGVSLYTADGWEVGVISYNAAEPKAEEYVSPEPPLSYDQLDQVVTSDAWFG